MRRFQTFSSPRPAQVIKKVVPVPVGLSSMEIDEGPLCPYMFAADGEIDSIRISISESKGINFLGRIVLENGPAIVSVDFLITQEQPVCFINKPVNVSAGDRIYIVALELHPEKEKRPEGLFFSFIFKMEG